jgi:hypothetical protein
MFSESTPRFLFMSEINIKETAKHNSNIFKHLQINELAIN